MTTTTDATSLNAEARALDICRSLDLAAGSTRVIAGQGEVNHVVVVDEQWVVRLPVDPRDDDVFGTEQWASSAARAVGVLTPEIVAVGDLDGWRYSVQHFTPGVHPDPTDLALWQQAGTWAAAISRVDMSTAPDTLFDRFGRDLRAAWRAHVDYNLAQLGPDDRLRHIGVLDAATSAELAARFADLRTPPGPFGVRHGDLRSPNLLVPPGATTSADWVVLDWGSVSTGPIVLAEVESLRHLVATGQAPPAALTAFAEASGWAEHVDDDAHTAYRLLQSVDLVRWALDRRPDLLDHYADAARGTLDEVLS